MCAKKGAKKRRALAGRCPSFRFQRNRAGRSHAMRVLLRARNSLRSFRCRARKPGTFRSAKKHKFQRQQLANLCFSKRVTPMAPDPSLRPKSRASPGWPRHAPAGAERQTRWRFPCARETARMTFARSGALRLPENGILKRGRSPARLRESTLMQQPYRWHAVGNANFLEGLSTPSRPARCKIPFFDASEGCEHTNVILAVSCACEKCHIFCRLGGPGGIGARRIEKCRSAIYWRKRSAFFSRAEPPGVLCYFLSFKKVGDMYLEKKPEHSAHNPNPQKETLNIQRLRQSHKKGTLKTQHTR